MKAVFDLEFDISFPFPAPEVLSIVLCLLIAMSIMMEAAFFTIHVVLFPPGFVNPEVEFSIWTLAHTDFLLLVGPLFNMTLLIIIVLPLLNAFRVASPFENGMLKTILTYPIRRRNLLILKGLAELILVVMPITIGAFIGVILIYWLDIGFDSLMLLLSFWSLSFLILSSSLLLSVIVRSTAKSAFGGIAMWITLYLVAALAKIPTLIRGILNPVSLSISYFSNTPGGAPFGSPFENITFNDIWVSILFDLLLGLVLFYVSIKFFRSVEV
jgi:ABC-type transport system involved in multi-copper enzyme maturation permease subunit